MDVFLISTAAPAAAPQAASDLWLLFRQSFDVFTVLLVLGSVVGVATIVRCLIDVRGGTIAPQASLIKIERLASQGRWDELRGAVADDWSITGRIVRHALAQPATDRSSLREAAELAASEESSAWFRKIELLNIIGNLGPLIGLAGTVWGMILAFTTLGAVGGQAGPTDLSLGISKALFHTLLGLCLAIPCLLVYGIYRGIIDRHCTRGMLAASRVVEMIPVDESKAPGDAGAAALLGARG